MPLGLYLENPNEVQLKEFPSTTTIKDDEVKIKLIYGGICGSDISVFAGKMAHAKYPVCPGHELVGEIIEAGKNVKEDVGKRVVVQPNSFCDECEYCTTGKRNICEHKKSLGVNTHGGFAQEFVISSKYIMAVPDELSNKKAVLIEPFSVIIHALEKVDISNGRSVAVIGCGTEGMLAITLAHHLGANITAIDINPNKFEKVRQIGNIKTSLPQDLTDETFDVVIEAAGARASMEQGVQLVKPGGSMVIVGMTPEATLPITQMVRNEITLYGSIIYNFPKDFAKSIDYLKQDDFHIDAVISKVYSFKDYKKAYEDAVSEEFGKIILDFKEETD